MIELILLERVEKLGQMGQLVKVKPGFARNYLLPQKKALRATKENLAYFETQRAQLEATNLQRKTEATEVGGKLEGLTVVLVRQAGESGQLYGSVSARDIAEAVTEAGFTIEKQQVVLDRPIRKSRLAFRTSGAAPGSVGHGHRQRRSVGRRSRDAGPWHQPAAACRRRRIRR